MDPTAPDAVANWSQTTANPFLCGDMAWSIQDGQGTINTWDLRISPFQFVQLAVMGFQGNALAYNVNDGLLYIARGDEHIFTLDAAGVVTDLGIPKDAAGVALPGANTYNIGTFGPDGKYYIADGGVAKLFVVDVKTGIYTTVPMASALGAWDWAYDPITGLLTTIENGTRWLRQVNPVTGAITRTQIGGTNTGANGAVFFDSAGTLYVYSNNGVLQRVDQPLTSGKVTVIDNGASATYNDGASCPFGAKVFKTVTPSSVPAGGTVTYQFDLYWQGPTVTTAMLSDTLSFGGLYVAGSVKVDGTATSTPLGGTATLNKSQMSLSNMTLTTGSHHVITVDVAIPPGATPGAVNNQATLDGLGATFPPQLSDLPTTGLVGDPTPLTILATPAVGVAKQAGTPVANGDGTFNVPYTFNVKNTGSTTLNNLTLVDNIAAELGPAFVAVTGDPVVTSAAAGKPVANTSYDPAGAGSLINGTAASLKVGESYTVAITVKVDPQKASGPLFNQATATGTDPVTGVVATDLSDSGTDPATGNPTAPGNTTDPATGAASTKDPTPLVIPLIGVAKSVSSVASPAVSGTIGNVDVTYSITVANTGNVVLTDVSLVDDLKKQFGGAFVRVVTQPVKTADTSTTAVASSTYDGSNSLATATRMTPGKSFTISVVVEVNPNGDATALPLQNTATATGKFTNVDGTTGSVTDDSDNGTSTTGNNGSGGTTDPTPLSIAQIGVAKSAGAPVAQPDGTFVIPYTFVVKNTGSVTLNKLSLTDDFAAQFGANFKNVVGAPVVAPPSAATANTAFNGRTNINLIVPATDSTLAPGGSFTVTVSIAVDPAADSAKLPLTNQATATGVDLGNPANTATDQSDNGTDPEGTNGVGGGTDPTVVQGAALGVAKSITSTVDAASNVPGNVDVTYKIVYANTGLEPLTNLSLTDDLAAQLGSTFVGVSTAPTVTVNPTSVTGISGNPTFSGKASGNVELLSATGAVLPAGATVTVEVTIEVNPNAPGAPTKLSNQATGKGVGTATATPVTDLSDSGTNPTGTNPGQPGNTGGPDDPTPLSVPRIGVAKSATFGPSASGVAGHYDVTFLITMKNTGNVALTKVQLDDDLATTFGASLVKVVSSSVDHSTLTATPPPALSTTYDGKVNKGLLDGLGTMAVGDSITVKLVVEIDPSAHTSGRPYQNVAVGSGTTLDGGVEGTTVTDNSDSGTDPAGSNPDQPGDTGGSNDPTPILIATIGLAKSAAIVGPATTPGNTIVRFTYNVKNTGSVLLTPITLTDDLTAQFGANFVAITAGPTITASTASTDPTLGSGNPDLFSGTDGGMLPGQTITLTVDVEINPTGDLARLPLKNQAKTTGAYHVVDEPSIIATDLSDSGTDPVGTNPTAPGATTDPSTAGTDPTPVAIPMLGVAKSVLGAPVAASSGTIGNFDVTYQYVVKNVGSEKLTPVTLTDDFTAQFGANFVRVVTPPVVAAPPPPGIAAMTLPSPGPGNPKLILGTDGVLAPGQSFVVKIVVELNPDADPAALPLDNTATATGTDQYGTAVTDKSTAGTDPNVGAGGPGTPTLVVLPQIGVAKSASNPVETATSGEFAVKYTFVVQNTGSETLTNLSLVDDLTTQLGAAFAGIQGPVTVTNIDATSVPAANSTFNGAAKTDLLAGTATDQVKPGQSFMVTVTVRLTPFADPSIKFPLENQATGAGDYTNPATGTTGTVTDLSDAGSNPSTNNGTGGATDLTAVDNPALRLAKAADKVTVNTDGSLDVTYRFELSNYGFVPVYGLTLTDPLVDQLGGPKVVTTVGKPVVVSQGANTAVTPAGGFDGTAAHPGLIVDTSVATGIPDKGLRPGESIVVTVPVHVVASAVTAPGPLLNQATATGVDAKGATATDLSDSGTKPETSNPGAPGDSGGTDDKTPLTAPSIRAAKSVTKVTPTGVPGVATVDYTIAVVNTGNETLTGLSLKEDLADTFGTALTIPSPTVKLVAGSTATKPPVVNAAYNGTSVTEILDGTGQLDPGQTYSVTVTATVKWSGDVTALPFENQVTVSGTTPSGTKVSDLSDSGTDPTSTNPTAPGATTDPATAGTDPTPVEFNELSVAKSVATTSPAASGTAGNFDVTYQLVVANVGTTALTTTSLTDDIKSQLGAAFVKVSKPPTILDAGTAVPAPVADATYDGTKVLATAAQLKSGEKFTVSVTVEVAASALAAKVSNQATATATGPDGSTVLDKSDSGTDPLSVNPTAPGASVDPITGVGSTIDPTPLTLPAVGIAKSVKSVTPESGVGLYTVEFSLKIANLGNVPVTSVSLVDDLATELGDAFVSAEAPVVSDPAVGAANAAFNGKTVTEMLNGTGALAVGASATVTVKVHLDTKRAKSLPLENSAKLSGTSPDGIKVTDVSDSGTDPSGSNNGAPGATVDPATGIGSTVDPTPVDIGALSLAKSAVKTVPAASGKTGDIDVTYQFVVANPGTVPITTATLSDDLVTQLGEAFVTVVTPPAVSDPGTISPAPTANSAYSGAAALASAASIKPGEKFVVTVTVEVNPDGNTAGLPLTNQALVKGTDPAGLEVTDLSDSGTDPLTNNGAGGTTDPTPLTLPQISVAKSARIIGPSTPGDTANYNAELTFVVANTGTELLSAPTLSDDLSKQWGSAFVSVVSPPVVDQIGVANVGFNGKSDLALLDSAASGVVSPGASFTVTVVAKINLPAATLPLLNQATATGTDSAGITVTDLSDSGTDPKTSNDAAPGASTATLTKNDDPTPLEFASVGIAKSVTKVSPAASGTAGNFDVTYQLVVANTGTVSLRGVDVTDDLAAQLGAGFVSVAVAPSVVDGGGVTPAPVPNASYNGSASSPVLSASVVKPRERFTGSVTVEVDASALPPGATNQAKVSGTDLNGAVVQDLSDSGSDPSTANPGAPGASVDPVTGLGRTDDPTPLALPSIAVAKTAEVIGAAASGAAGHYDVKLTFAVANTGNQTLSSLKLSDDLATQWGAAFVSVVSAPLADRIGVANAGYNGRSDIGLLDPTASGALAPAGTFAVAVVVEVDVPAAKLPMLNQATVSGTDPAGTTVTDRSDSGPDPKTSNDAAPGASTAVNTKNDDPTPLSIPAIGVAKAVKAVTPAGLDEFDVTFEVVATNTGTTDLKSVSFQDDLAKRFGSAFVKVVSVTSTDVAVNPQFDGVNVTDLLLNTSTLAVGKSGRVTLTVRINPDAAGAPAALANQVRASGTSVDNPSLTVSDLSDSGTSPTGSNPGQPGDTGSANDPTPVVLPSYAVDKAEISNVDNGDGTRTLTYEITVVNTGNTPITNVAAYDDATSIYADANLNLGSLKATDGTGIANSAWAGTKTSNVFKAGQSVPIRKSLSARVSFVLSPPTSKPYTNTAVGYAEGPSGALPPRSDSVTTNVVSNRGTVSGSVFVDSNGDGKPSPGEAPLGGVSIVLRAADGTVVAKTISNADGSYTFTGVVPGKYTVEEAQPAGYGSSTASTQPVSVGAGSTARVDFGEVLGGISGRIWLDVNGNGQQDAGETLGSAGTVVNLYNSAGALVATTTTDRNGSYHFDNLVAGSYVVGLVAPSGLVIAPPNQGIDATDSDFDSSTGRSQPIVIGPKGCTDTAAAGCVLTTPVVDGGLVTAVPVVKGSITVDPVDAKTGAEVKVGVTPTNQSVIPLPKGVIVQVTLPPGLDLVRVDAPSGYKITVTGPQITAEWSAALTPGDSPPPFTVVTKAGKTPGTWTITADFAAVGFNTPPVVAIPITVRVSTTELARTGANSWDIGEFAVVLMAFGLLLAVSSRRRNSAAAAS